MTLTVHGISVAAEATSKAFKNERQKREERELRDKQRRYVLPDIKIPLTSPLDTEDLHEHLQTHLSPLAPGLRLQLGRHIDEHTHSSNSISITSRLQDILNKNRTNLFTSRDVNNGKLPKLGDRSNTVLPPIHRKGVHTSQSHQAAMTASNQHNQLTNPMTLSLSEINIERVNRASRKTSTHTRALQKLSSQSQLKPSSVAFENGLSGDESDSASMTSSRLDKTSKQSVNAARSKKGEHSSLWYM